MLGQSKTAHQAEIDAACELIDFLRFNVALRPGARRGQPTAAPACGTGWSPPARGLRLRGHAVQLHGHRRQPVRGAGADGQHRRLEAGLDGGARSYYVMQPAPGGRPARRRHQLRAGQRRRDLARPRSSTRRWPACTSPARRRSSRASGARSARTSTATARTRAWSARPAARTSSSPTPRPTPRPSPRRIVRGAFEYQGQKCSAASRLYVPDNLWARRARQLVRDDRAHPHGRRGATSRTSWAR